MFARRFSLAALISLGFIAAAAANDLAIGGYRLGMSLEDFRSQKIPGDTARPTQRILCSYEREMQDHMVGILRYQFENSAKAGALVCIFAEPDRASGVRSGWWEESQAPFAGHAMKWRFWFTGSRAQPASWALFAFAAYGAEKTAGDPNAVAAIQSRLVQEIGAGTPFADDGHKGFIWNSGSGRAAFLVRQATDARDDSSICFGIADLPTVAAINQRLAPSSMRLTSLCSPDAPKSPTSP